MGFLDWAKKLVTGIDPLDTIEGIRAIPVPKRRETKPHDVKQGMEYILQRKATEHKKNGRMDLAIECLRKSNELMPYSFYEYTRKDYERLAKYLRSANRISEAEIEERKLNQKFGNEQIAKSRQKKYDLQFLKDARATGTDLVEMTTHHPTCGECAKYQGRVFSISGKDKRFPKLPEQVLKTGKMHEGCRHGFNPFYYGISRSNNGVKDVKGYSNRPFVDDRPEQERQEWAKMEAEALSEKKDRADYAWLQKHLPNDCPKSFGGYRKMKNANSANYQKLMETAKSAGFKG